MPVVPSYMSRGRGISRPLGAVYGDAREFGAAPATSPSRFARVIDARARNGAMATIGRANDEDPCLIDRAVALGARICDDAIVAVTGRKVFPIFR
jgi:hypothetical protein